jgi:SWI/SNF-related matrix-associated actin-dependent regulator of chromatin subfamily A3
MCLLKAQHGWCLTGTPIQNRVDDFGALLCFLRVVPFHDRATFASVIANPIEMGDESGLPKLRLLINSTTLRRTKACLGSGIQSKRRIDILQMLDFSPKGQELYNFFRVNSPKAIDDISKAYGTSTSIGSVFKTILRLRQISNHGARLLSPQALRAFKEKKR